jgi:hypothetical protein
MEVSFPELPALYANWKTFKPSLAFILLARGGGGGCITPIWAKSSAELRIRFQDLFGRIRTRSFRHDPFSTLGLKERLSIYRCIR